MRIGARSFDRYFLVGLFNTGVDLVLFSALTVGVGLSPAVGNTLSTVCVMTMSYFINRAWVFRSSAKGFLTFVRFSAATLFTGLVVQTAVIYAVLAACDALAPGLPEAIATPGAKIIAMGTGMVVNFVAYRWLFRPRTPSTGHRSPSA